MCSLKKSTERVQAVLIKLGYDEISIKEFSDSTVLLRAADVIGCTVGQIAKSLIFKENVSKPILIITNGSNRVNEKERI